MKRIPYDQQDPDQAGRPASLRPLPGDLVLGGIRVVLVAPKTEANIGAVARACGNFEVQGRASDYWPLR